MKPTRNFMFPGVVCTVLTLLCVDDLSARRHRVDEVDAGDTVQVAGWFGRKKDAEKPAKDAKANIDPEKEIYQWLKTYSEVVSLVEKKSFKMPSFTEFIQNSLKSAVAGVDAHSAFLTQESYKAAMDSTSGEFSGIGVSIISKTLEDDALVIVDVVPGSPAEKAGLKSGDKMVEADGQKFRGLSSDEAINKLKGKSGSVVKIKIIRKKKPLEFKVKRDVIKDQPSMCYLFKTSRVYYLSLKIFTENAASQMSELLKVANEGKCQGIVLDLRRNPGGILQSAIEMAGLFLDKNSLVTVTKDKERAIVDKYFTSSNPVLKTDVPIVILIDNFTASAAEILAGALRYHSVKSYEKNGKKNGSNLLVFLLGTPTFGKGSVQEVMPIGNGCALKLTTMLYYLPDDSSIQATGIEPDFVIKPKLVPTSELKWIEGMYGKESSLKGHITKAEATGKPEDKKNEKDKKGGKDGLRSIVDLDDEEDELWSGDEDAKKMKDSPEKWDAQQKKMLGLDVQVQAAVNIVNLLTIGRKCDPNLASRQKALEFIKQNYLTDGDVAVEKVK